MVIFSGEFSVFWSVLGMYGLFVQKISRCIETLRPDYDSFRPEIHKSAVSCVKNRKNVFLWDVILELARVLLVFVRGKVSKFGDAVAMVFMKRTHKTCKSLSGKSLATS